MPYLIRYHQGQNPLEGQLIEATRAEVKAALEGRHDQHRYGVRFKTADREAAHAWVRMGWPHATSLWLDQGRIRRS